MTSKDDYIEELEQECFDLVAKIICLLNEQNLWNDDATYTFSDGDRWARFDPEVEQVYLDYTKEENECYE